MDIMPVVAAAVSAVSARIADAGLDLAQHSGEQVTDQLCALIIKRLRSSLTGSHALSQIERRPADLAARESATLVIADEAGRDTQFAVALAELVRALPATSVAAGPATSGGMSVTTGGSFDNQQGVIAGPGSSVRQSHRTRISTGGWLVIVVVLVILGTGGIITGLITGSRLPGPIVGAWMTTGPNELNDITLYITSDGSYRFDSLFFGPMWCTGRVAKSTGDRQYSFTAEGGTCSSFVGQLSPSGSMLTFRHQGSLAPLWTRSQ